MDFKVNQLRRSLRSGESSSHFSLGPISFSLNSHSILGIIGKSGSGKSTLLRCLNMLEPLDSGSIELNHINLSSLSTSDLKPYRRHIGFIAQASNLLSHKTVLENVLLPLKIAGGIGGKITTAHIKIAEDALGKVGLVALKDRYPSQLSGGQRQRISIARALVTQPTILLCDEITSALDPTTTQEILSLISQINRELKVGIIFVTHDMDVVKSIATDVLVIDHGQVVEQGKCEDVIPSPQNSITRELTACLWQNQLPQFLVGELKTAPTGELDQIVLKLSFLSQNATKPLMAHLMREKGIDLNIIGGSLDHIGTTTFGTLYVTAPNGPLIKNSMIAYLADHHVKTETLGYLPWN